MGQATRRLKEIAGDAAHLINIVQNNTNVPRCFPPFPIPTGKGGDQGERKVFEKLQSVLNSEWRLFHSFAVPERNRPGQSWQSDIDFILIHPKKGIFIIEVKDIPIRIEGDQWYVQYKGQDRIDIRKKALGVADFLLNYIRSSTRDISRNNNLHDFLQAVIVVGLQNKFSPPANQSPAIQEARTKTYLWSKPDTDNLSDKLELFPNPEPMNGQSWRSLTQLLEDQARRLYKCSALTALIASDRLDRSFDEMERDPEFVKKYRDISESQSLLLKGFAGTGKTQLLLQSVAHNCKSPGARQLVLCFNDLLAEWLGERLKNYPNTIVTSFHGFCRTLAANIDKDFANIPETDKSNYFAKDLPWIIKMAINDGVFAKMRPYTSIYIDEAQDWDQNWLEIIESIANADTRWFCNFDSSQQWQIDHKIQNNFLSEKDHFWKKFNVLELSNNLRNPINIRNTALGHLKKIIPHPQQRFLAHPFKDAQEGINKHQAIRGKDVASHLGRIVEELIGTNGLNLSQIVVLSDCGLDKLKKGQSLLQYGQKIGPYVLSETFGDHQVRLDTIRRFKGLELDIVIAVFENFISGEEKSERLAYLAATRARGGYYAIFVTT